MQKSDFCLRLIRCAAAGNAGGLAPALISPLLGASDEVRSARLDEEAVPFNATSMQTCVRSIGVVDGTLADAGKPGVALSRVPVRSDSFTVRAVDGHGRTDNRESVCCTGQRAWETLLKPSFRLSPA